MQLSVFGSGDLVSTAEFKIGMKLIRWLYGCWMLTRRIAQYTLWSSSVRSVRGKENRLLCRKPRRPGISPNLASLYIAICLGFLIFRHSGGRLGCGPGAPCVGVSRRWLRGCRPTPLNTHRSKLGCFLLERYLFARRVGLSCVSATFRTLKHVNSAV